LRIQELVEARNRIVDGLTERLVYDIIAAALNVTYPIGAIAVIYGYAFEGHCYDLPKPQIMLLPKKKDRARGEAEAQAETIDGPEEMVDGDCGYKADLGYVVWTIDKKIQCVTIDMQSDEIQKLILDQNVPGKRSPMVYAQSMRLASPRAGDA
jgi:hypothetical protein